MLVVMPPDSAWCYDILSAIAFAGFVPVPLLFHSPMRDATERSGRFLIRRLVAVGRLGQKVFQSSRLNEGATVFATYGGLLGCTAILAARAARRDVLVFLAGSDLLRISRAASVLAFPLYRRASVLLLAGPHMIAAATKEGLHDVAVPWHHGIDVASFNGPGIEAPARFLRIVVLRTFAAVYDNPTILDGLRQLNPGLAWQAVFAAGGPDLEVVRPRYNDLKGVEFLGGYTRERLVEILQWSNIYISASLSDGTSTSLLEAIASGQIAIVSDIPANRDFFQKLGIHAHLFEPGNASHLAAILADVAENLERELVLSARNRGVVAEQCSTMKAGSSLQQICDARLPRQQRKS
jgi:glycosyltransferase involved in cell wall biosynthesis